MTHELNRIYLGDCLETMRTWPDGFIHTVVTSPPYWGLRNYGVEGQFGLEKSPEEYVRRMVEVFREVRRVMRDDGTLWLNLGDSYIGSGCGGSSEVGGLKPKDLCGIPWRVAFALQADGWYLRSDIIWNKPNPMPESVTDRPTKSHEYIFLLTKSPDYFYDAEAIKEPAKDWGSRDRRGQERFENGVMPGGAPHTGLTDGDFSSRGRNKRSVWTITTKAFSEAHFATFPEDLIEPCILAGTSQRGVCEGCGAPWDRVLERFDTGLKQKMPDGFATHEGGHGSFHREGREKGKINVPVMANRTTGWNPT